MPEVFESECMSELIVEMGTCMYRCCETDAGIYVKSWGVDTGQKACTTPKAWYAPLGTHLCVGQPQGVCEVGP